jgi:hypothetical protein
LARHRAEKGCAVGVTPLITVFDLTLLQILEHLCHADNILVRCNSVELALITVDPLARTPRHLRV